MKLALSRSNHMWIIAALVISATTGVATWSLHNGTASTISNPIQGLTITPDPASVEAGGTLRLTAEGDFGTMTMPVRADWFYLEPESEATGTLEGCERSKTCDFHADDTAGVAVIQAQVGDGDAVAVAKITVTESLKNPFKDELPAWALPSIVNLYRQGIVKGYDDGRYGPADSLTRGQIVTLIVRMLTKANLIQEGESCTRAPSDIPATHYAYAAVCAFGNRGWIVSKGNFRPDAVASRGDAAGFLASATLETLEKDGAAGTARVFEDIPVSSPFFRATALLQRAGIMTGYPNGDFGVGDPLNRAAAATVVERMLKILGKSGVHTLPSAPAPAVNPVASLPPAPAPAIPTSPDTSSILPTDLGQVRSVRDITWPKAWFQNAEHPTCTAPDAVRPPIPEGFRCCEACPSNESTRFYLPFAGNDCESGDAVRDDLSPKECANPLIETGTNPEEMPKTYGTHCPQFRLRSALPLSPLAAQVRQSTVNPGSDLPPNLVDCTPWEQDLQRAENAVAQKRAERDAVTHEKTRTENHIADTQARMNALHAQNPEWKSRYKSFVTNKAIDDGGYPINPQTGERLQQHVKTATAFFKEERALSFLSGLKASLQAKLEAAEAALQESVRHRNQANSNLDDCRRTRNQRIQDWNNEQAQKRIKEKNAAEAATRARENTRQQEIIDRRTKDDGHFPPGIGTFDQCCNGEARHSYYTCTYVSLDHDSSVSFGWTHGPTFDPDAYEKFKQFMGAVDWIATIASGYPFDPGGMIGMVGGYVAGWMGINMDHGSMIDDSAVFDLMDELIANFPRQIDNIVIPVRVDTILYHTSYRAESDTSASQYCVDMRWRKDQWTVPRSSVEEKTYVCDLFLGANTTDEIKYRFHDEDQTRCRPANGQELLRKIAELTSDAFEVPLQLQLENDTRCATTLPAEFQ